MNFALNRLKPLGLKWRSLLLLCTVLSRSACTAGLKEYAATEPAFDMQSFFNGKLQAYGMVQTQS